MKRLLLSLSLSLWLLCCCAVSAQVPNGVANGVPNAAPFVGFSAVAKSGTASAVTGTAAETILATIAIAPNAIGANGQIRIRTYWTITNSANNKNLRARLGTTGVSSTLISNSVVTTFTSPLITIDIQNLNATNSQNDFTEGTRGTDGLVTTVLLTSAIDMTVGENIYITGQLALSTETITLTGYSVEYAN